MWYLSGTTIYMCAYIDYIVPYATYVTYAA